MDLQENNLDVKRSFTINEKLLKEFKETSKRESKTYRRAVEEALKLWLKHYQDPKGSDDK